MILRVFDVPNIIRTGLSNRVATIMGGVVNTPSGYKALEMKSGGISLLFRMIKKYKNDTLIFCCDREPTVKRGFDPTYKMTKKDYENDSDYAKQIKAIEIILKDCGYNVLAKDGYEADDLIFSTVKKYKDLAQEVIVHTKDSDLCLLVEQNVSIGPVGNNNREVNMENYELAVTKKQLTPYNTATLSKIYHGDTSDGVKAGNRSAVHKIKEIIESSKVLPTLCGSYDFLYNLFKSEAPELIPQLNIIFPLQIDVEVNLELKPINDNIEAWGYISNCGDYKKKPENEVEILKKIYEYF